MNFISYFYLIYALYSFFNKKVLSLTIYNKNKNISSNKKYLFKITKNSKKKFIYNNKRK